MLNAEAVFLAALDKPTAQERAAYVEGACAGQPELLARVRELLAAHEQSQGPLDVPPSWLMATVDEQPITERPGSTIGPYKLLQKIGEGGMGVVYMAEQLEPVRRKVALKIIKPGMDSAGVLARFEAERQALAMMDHPNIARILDAGATASGRPYFVMELVQGIPITTFCDERQLTPREQLQLFVPICQAIQHAHQKGIIHRDIKPSNVLVTMYDDKPVPKVIDFGVAKAIEQRLTEKTLFTQFGTLVGTFEYMSPEQAELNAFGVDTRSDVYSLGVLLYELLTGTTPLEKQRLREAALGEMIRLIREEEPPLPSVRLSTSGTLAKTAAARKTEPTQLSRLVRGELDWIAMKSLEKDRTRRYESASDLGRDVERYLQDEPVEACPPSVGYRLRKFVRRHRGPVLVGAMLVGVLLFGIVGTTFGMVRAIRMQEEAMDARKAETYHREKTEQARQDAVTLAEKELVARTQAEQERDRAKFQALRAENAQHAIQIDLAMRAWERHDVAETERILDEVAEAFQQTWEHRHLRELCRRKARPLVDPNGCTTLAVSPDGQRIFTGSTDGTIKAWDMTTGKVLSTFQGHTGTVSNVALSANGERLVSTCGTNDPGQVKVWDTHTGKCVLALKGESETMGIAAISADGKRLAAAVRNGTTPLGVKVWDVDGGQEQLWIKANGFGFEAVAFSPDGKHLTAGGNDQSVHVWDASTGERKFSVQLQSQLRGYVAVAFSLTFSPDGLRLVAGLGDRSARVFDLATGQEKVLLKGHKDNVTCVVFSTDGKHIYSASEDRTVKMWDAATGLELFSLRGHAAGVRGLALSRDGQRIVTGGRESMFRVWELGTPEELFTLKGHTGGVHSVAWSPDGKRILTGSSDKSVRVWDDAKGLELFALQGHDNRVCSVAFSPKGERIASLSSNDILKVWDVATRKEMLAVLASSRAAIQIAFSPDGRRLISGSDIGLVHVWDAANGKELFTLQQEYCSCVAFSPDGQFVLTGSGKNVKVRESLQGVEKLSLEGHTRQVLGVASSDDGKRIVSAGQDGILQVWDGDTGRNLFTLKGHTDQVTSVAISPDGQRIVSGSYDGLVKVWDMVTGQEKFTLKGHTLPVHCVAVSPDGQRIASASGDGTVKVWDAPPVSEK